MPSGTATATDEAFRQHRSTFCRRPPRQAARQRRFDDDFCSAPARPAAPPCHPSLSATSRWFSLSSERQGQPVGTFGHSRRYHQRPDAVELDPLQLRLGVGRLSRV